MCIDLTFILYKVLLNFSILEAKWKIRCPISCLLSCLCRKAELNGRSVGIKIKFSDWERRKLDQSQSGEFQISYCENFVLKTRNIRESIRKIEVNLIKFSKGLLLADVKHTFSHKRIQFGKAYHRNLIRHSNSKQDKEFSLKRMHRKCLFLLLPPTSSTSAHKCIANGANELLILTRFKGAKYNGK